MYKALKRRKEERKKAIHLSAEYAKNLEKNIGSFTAILHGSYARGDFNSGSDIDVLVISDSLPSNALERMDLLYQHVQGGIDPKGYTRAEFLKMLRSNNPLAVDAMENGEVLSDDGFWNSKKQLSEMIKPKD